MLECYNNEVVEKAKLGLLKLTGEMFSNLYSDQTENEEQAIVPNDSIQVIDIYKCQAYKAAELKSQKSFKTSSAVPTLSIFDCTRHFALLFFVAILWQFDQSYAFNVLY